MRWRGVGDTSGKGEVTCVRGASVEGEEDHGRMWRDTGSGVRAARTRPVSPRAGDIMIGVRGVEGQIHFVEAEGVYVGVGFGEDLECPVEGVGGA